MGRAKKAESWWCLLVGGICYLCNFFFVFRGTLVLAILLKELFRDFRSVGRKNINKNIRHYIKTLLGRSVGLPSRFSVLRIALSTDVRGRATRMGRVSMRKGGVGSSH